MRGYIPILTGALVSIPLMLATALYANDDIWANHALIIGRPISVRILLSSDDVDGQEIVLGDSYKVKLDRVKAIYGKFEERKIEVELFASHAESISSKSSIFVLIRIRNGGVTPVYWGVPRSIACFPKKLIMDEGIEEDFKTLNRHTNELCTNTQWFR